MPRKAHQFLMLMHFDLSAAAPLCVIKKAQTLR